MSNQPIFQHTIAIHRVVAAYSAFSALLQPKNTHHKPFRYSVYAAALEFPADFFQKVPSFPILLLAAEIGAEIASFPRLSFFLRDLDELVTGLC